MFDKELVDQLEPSENQRSAARSIYGLFTALLDEGFDETQAMQLVSAVVAAVVTDD